MLRQYMKQAESLLNENKMLYLKPKCHWLAAACLLGLTTASIADSATSEGVTAYVDSAYEWGSWELGLMPAAGGPAPSPQRAVTARNTNVQFRPNDNSAYAPTAQIVRQTTVMPAPLPAPVPVPAAPTSGPAAPNQPPVTGGPGDRFF